MVSEDRKPVHKGSGRRRKRHPSRLDQSQTHRPLRQNLDRNLRFPESLPVSARRDEIMAAIRNHQVVIIAGETGSGKTTQLPKMCLALGRGAQGRIGHTQPRRIAARSVADRIAEELGERVGQPGGRVGYKIRFDDTVSDSTAIKIMTDGILLAEIQHDRLLRSYDTIIIDEAHERSLNIDFLLGYLREILPQRPDLKVIITSATIDPESFAEHFADSSGEPAPIIEVSGRTYPVEIRYRPLVRTSGADENGDGGREIESDPVDGLLEAVGELIAEGPGDILCFFSGEREIRDAAEALRGSSVGQVDILPLFGRLSAAEQHRVFSTGPRRRIILATNIAETSLTVPGIRYVIDTGYARISRYSHRTKVQRLPVEEISQASARQRSGRCGRTSDGIAIRLYSEEDFKTRPEFTDPEILRTHLSSVILSMSALGLGDITDFPFLQPPDAKSVRDGVQLLQELGAFAPGGAGTSTDRPLTPIGQNMARIPTDPRLARMLVAAHEHDVLEQIAVIVAALSIQDVRERPLEQQVQADQAHARFAADSDFISLLKLWNHLQEQRRELSGNQFRQQCRKEFIHYVRVREWMDLVRQFLTIIQDLQWKVPNIRHVRNLTFDLGSADGRSPSPDSTPLAEDDVHKALLTGLLTNIGLREGGTRQFLGTRNSRFVIHPSSHLAKKPPQWVMAAELVETSQVFARTVGPLTPEWVEQVAPHMVKYSYSEPHWSSRRGAAMIHQKALLRGLPIIPDRTVPLSKVDPGAARETFIRSALVEGDWHTRHAFFRHNQELLEHATQLEEKARRRDIVVDDDTLYDFYDSRIPETVVSARHFDSWWKKVRDGSPRLLDFTEDALISSDQQAAQAREFPDTWRQGSVEYELEYVFRPGDPADGITMKVPLPLLAGLQDTDTRWLVAGMREELCIALIRSLPKPLRTSVVPAGEFARAALTRMTPYDGPVDEALANALRSLGGTGISATDFDWSRLPDHLRMAFAAVDRRGKVISRSRDLRGLQEDLAGEITRSIATVAARQASGSVGTPAPSDAAAHQRRSGHRRPGGTATTSGVEDPNTTGTPAGVRGGEAGVLARADEWSVNGIGVIPETVESVVDGQPVTAYPALVVNDRKITSGATSASVLLKAFPTPQAAAGAQFTAVLRMMLDNCRVQPAQMIKGLALRQRVAVESYPYGGPEALIEDCRVLSCRDLLTEFGSVIRDPDRCAEAVAAAHQRGPGLVRQTVVTIAPAILAVADMSAELENWDGDSITEMHSQLKFYVGPHRITRNGAAHLRHVPRYVAAMQARLEMMEHDPDREAELSAQVKECLEAVRGTRDRLPSSRAASPQIKDVEWLIEELRVTLFAQHLGTTRTASVQRVRKALSKIN